jgi:hypothetical protein
VEVLPHIRDGRKVGTLNQEKETDMLWTLAVILFVLWGLGLVTSVTAGGLVHLLLVGAVIIVLVRVITGRRIT